MKNIGKESKIGKKILGLIKKIFSHKWVRVVTIIIVVFFIISTAISSLIKNSKNIMEKMGTKTEFSEKRDIIKVLSSSGTIAPLNTYEVTTLVDGEVVSADFEEGDQVEEGDTLYQVTTESLDTKVKSAKKSVEKAERDYKKAINNKKKAKKDYSDAVEDSDELAVKADTNGIVSELLVEEGDNVTVGGQIAKIYDNRYMLLTVPFNSAEVKASLVGKAAKVEIDESGEILKGTVTKIGGIEEVLSGNRVIKKVTIKVKNPGGITAETTATATINKTMSNDSGVFEVLEDEALLAEYSGEVVALKVKEGDLVKKEDVILILDSDTVNNEVEDYLDAVDNAQYSVEDAKSAVEDAKLTLEDQIEVLTDYNITAPISGQIVSKNTLEGDKINASNMTSSLCTIYDLSALKFEMLIDELDIMNIKIGQEVNITADAIDDTTFTGVITNISLKSTTSGGVTQYPVTVKIDELKNLLPGMNVTGEIVVEKVINVLTVPVEALMHGDVVYVKNETVKEAVGDVPAGFREVKVEIGISDDSFIEIKSGLEEKEEVYVVIPERSTDMMFMEGDGGDYEESESGDQDGDSNGSQEE